MQLSTILNVLPLIALGLIGPPGCTDSGRRSGPRRSSYRYQEANRQRHPSIHDRRANRKAQRQAKRRGR